jgi:hypothetical protein
MSDVEPGQVWEVYSINEGRWVRAIVTKIEGEEATLRYEGFLEFITFGVSDLRNKPECFRPAEAAGSSP